jgi:hypothetical protein
MSIRSGIDKIIFFIYYVRTVKIIIPPRTFQKNGKWVEKPRISEVLVCFCGNKYIKTRKDQVICVRCLAKVISPK